MASRKSRPVLYELVRKGQRQRQQDWRPADGGEKAPEHAESPQTSPTPPLRDPFGDELQLVRLIDGKLQLNLGWVSGVVVCIVLVMLVGIAFQAGAKTGDGPQDESTTVADNVSVPARKTVDGIGTPGRSDIGSDIDIPVGDRRDPDSSVDEERLTAPSPSPWPELTEPGNYLIVQVLFNYTDAIGRGAVELMAEKGIPCTVVRNSKGKYLLVSTERITSNSQKMALVRKVHALGNVRFVEGSDPYNLTQCDPTYTYPVK